MSGVVRREVVVVSNDRGVGGKRGLVDAVLAIECPTSSQAGRE